MTLVGVLAILLCAALAMVARHIRRFRGVMLEQLAACRRADYEGQLKIAERFRVNGSRPPTYLFFRGLACLQLGRLEEAERLLREVLPRLPNPVLQMASIYGLGQVLMERGLYDDAVACFETCIEELPGRGSGFGYCGMAEVRLRRGTQDEAALEAARRSVEANRTRPVRRGELSAEERALQLSVSLGFLAWALARNAAAPAQVEAALTEAFALCGQSRKPGLSRIHYCAGQAYSALGNSSESARHFRSAIEADPVGVYGRLARAANCTTG